MIGTLLTLLLALPAQAPAQDAPAAPELTRSRLKDEIDLSLRWVRAQQNPEDGSYGARGGSLRETLAALDAFARSPRAYRASDGPFVGGAVEYLLAAQNEEGAIAQPQAPHAMRLAQTLLAVSVLERVADEEAKPAIGRALSFVAGEAERPEEDPYASYWRRITESEPDGRVALLSYAEALLARRDETGAWPDEGNGELLATTGQLSALSSLHAYLKAFEPRPEPRQATELPAISAADRAAVTRALERGAAFLLTRRDGEHWGFQGRADPGITAMVVGALLTLPEPRPEPVQAALEKSLDWLVSLQKADGSIHAGQLANYVTSASVLALVRAGREADSDVVARARDYLCVLQADEGEGYGSSERFYGGVGYGGDERPDLSNMQMALEALAASGLEAGDETFEKALVFLQRCQNRSESNDFSMTNEGVTLVSGNDGGAGYAPGDSKAGFVELSDGRRVPRSYGSMTYALLKGYLFAGLPKTDPRVVAAHDWLRENYTLDVNPGFEGSSDPTAAYQGLFYYFYTMARALDLYGEDEILDNAGVAHSWRAELAGRLLAMQRQDGSWINDNAPRWYEGNPVLATAYALLTLEAALPND